MPGGIGGYLEDAFLDITSPIYRKQFVLIRNTDPERQQFRYLIHLPVGQPTDALSDLCSGDGHDLIHLNL